MYASVDVTLVVYQMSVSVCVSVPVSVPVPVPVLVPVPVPVDVDVWQLFANGVAKEIRDMRKTARLQVPLRVATPLRGCDAVAVIEP